MILKNNKKTIHLLELEICKIAHKRGHLVLFGSLNNPNDLLAELLNAYIKQLVKKRNKIGRGIKQLYEDIQCGMYGEYYAHDFRWHEKITSCFATHGFVNVN